MKTKAPQEYWEHAYEQTRFAVAPEDHALRRWIEAWAPPVPGASAFEVGCYPGRFLAALGERGYELNGIDAMEDVARMADWMRSRGYRVGDIECGDFFGFESGRRFNVVLSLGFIEHFIEWEAVLDRHAELVSPGGLLLVEAPNFVGGFQNWLHRTFDAENLAHHHLPAMDPGAWSHRLRGLGFEILMSGFFGRFSFWVEPAERGPFERAALLALRAGRRMLAPLLPPGRRAYAPVCGVVARRHATPARA